MNKKSILFKTIALATVFTLNASLYVVLNKKAAVVEASSYSVNSVPTTINLNDTSESSIRSYYSSLNNLSANERKGTNLLKNLKPILKNGQKYFSYGSSATKAVWQAYEIVDRDWDKSPASSISGYNAQTKIITGYVYGTSNSSVGTNPYIHALYVNRNVNNQTRAWGNHEQDQWGINQEHIWAKSCGFENSSPAAGARGDLMHLWAGNGRVNGNTHSNYYYGYVDTTKTYNNAGSYASTLSGNLRGNSKTLGGSVTVFEPQDCDKGDIARAIFYMAARYNYLSGSDSDGIDAGNPNLEIVNNTTSWSNSGYQSSTSTTGKMGILQDLLEWNRLDPPDEWEIHRNNLLYNNFTNNRNPFIDFPSWADAIWGVSENGNYDPTPTKSASPASDPINTTEVSETFDISTSTLELEVGDTATIFGKNANSDINWTVDDDTVVSLNKNTSATGENVTVTALNSGTATITATCGSDSVNCSVTVSETIGIDYGTPSDPITVDDAINVISITGASETAQPICVKGVVSSASYSQQHSDFNYVWLKSNDGKTSQALQLYHAVLDDSLFEKYSNNNELVDKEIVARGYGKIYNSSIYELCTSSKVPNAPIILSVEGSEIEDCLNNQVPYLNLLATEHEAEQGGSTTFQFANSGLANGTDVVDLSIGAGVTISGDLGSNPNGNTPKYYDNNCIGEMRVYKGNTFTLTSATAMTNVEISFSGDSYSSNLTANVGTLSNGVWTGSATSITFTNSNQTNTQIRFRTISVTLAGVDYYLSDVALRLGVVFPKADWASIHTNWPITDYGVMIVSKDTLNDTYGVNKIADAFDNGEYLLDIHRGSYAEPWSMDEDNYAFTIKLSVTLQSNYRTTYCAAPYIVAGGEHYFLTQIETSVKDLADYYLEHGGSSLSNAALTLLSETH